MALTRAQTSTVSARTTETSTDQHGSGRRDISPAAAAVAYLRNELNLSWRQIARSLKVGVSTARRLYAQAPIQSQTAEGTHSKPAQRQTEQNRRGRPYAALTIPEVIRLRESGLSWREIGTQLGADASSVRRAYRRACTTGDCVKIRSTPYQIAATAIPESPADAVSHPTEPTPAAEPPRESLLSGIMKMFEPPRCDPGELRGPLEEMAWIQYHGSLSHDEIRLAVDGALERVRQRCPDLNIDEVNAVAQATRQFWCVLSLDQFIENLQPRGQVAAGATAADSSGAPPDPWHGQQSARAAGFLGRALRKNGLRSISGSEARGPRGAGGRRH